MKKNKQTIFLLLTLFVSTVQAGAMASVSERAAWRWVGSINGGPAWSQPGQTQTFYLQSDIQKTYANTTQTKTLGVGEIFLGVQHPFYSNLITQFGLAVEGATPMTLTGNIWEDADPDFNNFDYSYQIQLAHVAVKVKMIADIQAIVQPYVSGSLGVGFNRANDFSISPKLIEEIAAPLFGAQTTTAFAYTVGLGIQKNLYKHWQVGMGYEFADWGKTALAAAPGQTVNAGIVLNHVYTHQLKFSVSVLS